MQSRYEQYRYVEVELDKILGIMDNLRINSDLDLEVRDILAKPKMFIEFEITDALDKIYDWADLKD